MVVCLPRKENPLQLNYSLIDNPVNQWYSNRCHVAVLTAERVRQTLVYALESLVQNGQSFLATHLNDNLQLFFDF